MNRYLWTYLVVLLSLVTLDCLWLGLVGQFYTASLSHLLAAQPSLIPVILFYPLYALGLAVFILVPALQAGASWRSVALRGVLFGLVAYGTYDLTNQATLRSWPLVVTLVDLCWGMCATAGAVLIARASSFFAAP